MFKRILAVVPAVSLGMAIVSAAPAFATATTATATVQVGVTAAVQATIGVAYSSGSSIICNVGTTVTGAVACTNTATLSGTIRTTKTNSGGASVSLLGAAVTGSGGSSVPASAFTMTCTGGVTGSPTFAGTAGTLASNLALGSAATCQSWTGTVVAPYSLVATLSVDSSQVPADTYTASGFTATVSAN